MKKILIATGGTGGHVIPAKIIKEHLKKNFEIYYSTDLRGLKYLSSDINKTIIIDTPRFNLSFYLPFRLIKLMYLILQSILFLKKEIVPFGAPLSLIMFVKFLVSIPVIPTILCLFNHLSKCFRDL